MPAGIIPRHEFCFWLHDEICRILIEADQSDQMQTWHDAMAGVAASASDKLSEESLRKLVANEGGIIAVPMKLDILMAVLSDFLHFLYEALIAFEKRKFNVGYCLLRKPLTENLIILSLLADDDDKFLKTFADGSLQKKQLSNIDKPEKISLFERVNAKTLLPNFADGELLYGIIFDKNFPGGLQRRMQLSTHVVTTKHPAIATPEFGLNNLFDIVNDDESYNVYNVLPLF